MPFHFPRTKASFLVAASLSSLLAVAAAPQPNPPAPQRDLAQIARERIQVADKACELAAEMARTGRSISAPLEWRRLQAQAHMDAPQSKADRLAFLDGYVRWLNENEQRSAKLYEAGVMSALDVSAAKYYRLEGEMWLAKAGRQ